MNDFYVRNLTNDPQILPSPVSISLDPKQRINLAKIPGVDAEEIANIKSALFKLEQAGKIAIEYVDDTEDAIGEAAEKAGDIHPLVVKDAMAENAFVQIPAWCGDTGSVGVAKTLKLCITDDHGKPTVLDSSRTVMTITASGSCKLNGTSSNVAQVTIVEGVGVFTALDNVAEAVDFAITGTAPTNPVTEQVLTIVTPCTVTFA